MKTNYIAFSLWGNRELYTIGAIRNAELAREIYKDWKVIVYYDHSVPEDIQNRLQELDVILIDMTDSNILGPFWRFKAVEIEDCGYAIFRDTDSRISVREKLAVDEWIRNGDTIHLMRDHPSHFIPFGSQTSSIMSGMWGMKGGAIEMTKRILDFCKDKDDYYGIDQAFLEEIYKEFQYAMTVHDDFFEHKPFPSKRIGFRFVGERIDEHGRPHAEDWKMLRSHMRKINPSLFRRIKNWFRGISK